MSLVDIEALRAPLNGDNPCGPDLRGEPEFRELEDAPADFAGMKPPELAKLVKRCGAMLLRTRDQMPAIVGIQAAARAGDIATATALFAFLAQLTDEHWENYHPGPAEDMAIGRVNELSALARPAAMLLPLQRLGIVSLPPPSTTEYTVATVELALDPVSAWTSEDDEKLEARVSSGSISAAAARSAKPNQEFGRQLRGIMIALSETERQRDAAADCLPQDFDAPAARQTAIALRSAAVVRQQQLQALSDQIYTLLDVFERKMGDSPSLGPVLNQLKSTIATITRFLETFPDPDAVPDADDSADTVADAGNGDAGPGPAGAATARKRFSGDTPQSRADVLVAIDAIIRYYGENEPTSPVPLMMRRVRNWVEMDFYALLEEISPDSIGDVRRLLAIASD
ncbi:MAG: ImpA family type VI secretion system protein [Sandarakinorhabdus sp.]